MDDEDCRGHQSHPDQDLNPDWLVWTPQDVKRFFENGRAKKAQESRSDQAARRTANATWVIAWLTLVMIGVAASQYVIFGRQLTVMQGQLDAMEADQRPWVKIILDSVNSLVIKDGNLSINVAFIIENVGKSPIIGFDVGSDITPITARNADGRNDFQKQSCNRIDRGGIDKERLTLFPQEKTTYNVSSSQAMAKYTENGADRGVFMLSGCVKYSIKDGRNFGETGFRYYISLPYSGEVLIPIPWADHAFKAGEIAASREAHGNYAK